MNGEGTMNDQLNTKNDSLDNLLNSTSSLLNSESPSYQLSSNELESKTKDGGLLGKFFGVRTDNASIHIVFVICVLLFILVVILSLSIKDSSNFRADLIKQLVNVILVSLGYIFGNRAN